jgi:outer membrane protein assembly factor BamA
MKKTKRSILLFLVFGLFTFLFAQQQTMRVASVSIQGNETASDRIIKLSMGLIEGSEVTSSDIQNGIKKLYNLRLFSDINGNR